MGISFVFLMIFPSLCLLTSFCLLPLFDILGKILGLGCKFFNFICWLVFYFVDLVLQCWVRTIVGVQCLMAMNVCSCWSRTEVLATMEPSHPCRSTTSTIMQVQLCLKDNIVLVLCVFVFALCVWNSVPNTVSQTHRSRLSERLQLSLFQVFTL